jgi:hypothetical protein
MCQGHLHLISTRPMDASPHVDAFHGLGIWIQAHHLALDYYDSICRRL